MDIAAKAYMAYYFVLGCTYAFVPEKPLEDSFPGLTGQDHYVTKLYHEVLGGLSFMLFLGCCPGTMGILMGTMAFVCTMAKHKFVDHVEPPIPVQAMVRRDSLSLSFLSVTYYYNDDLNNKKKTGCILPSSCIVRTCQEIEHWKMGLHGVQCFECIRVLHRYGDRHSRKFSESQYIFERILRGLEMY